MFVLGMCTGFPCSETLRKPLFFLFTISQHSAFLAQALDFGKLVHLLLKLSGLLLNGLASPSLLLSGLRSACAPIVTGMRGPCRAGMAASPDLGTQSSFNKSSWNK